VGLPATTGRAGLGTSVVDTLARQIGATVARRSAPGAGTTICLLLPRGSETGYFMTSATVVTQPQPSS